MQNQTYKKTLFLSLGKDKSFLGWSISMATALRVSTNVNLIKSFVKHEKKNLLLLLLFEVLNVGKRFYKDAD